MDPTLHFTVLTLFNYEQYGSAITKEMRGEQNTGSVMRS